jgi:DNA-directed RNA polymerase subunit M/transcription elongation factor TFIIS
MQLLAQHLSIEKLAILQPYILNAYESLDTAQYTLDDFCYQIIGYLHHNPSLPDLLTLLYTNKTAFNHPVYNEHRHREDEENLFITTPFQVDEGVMVCKCGSKRTISFQKQVRSSDEGFSIFCQCVECGNKWREN